MNSPLRLPNEPHLLRELNRVRPRFETKSGDFRKNWYKGDLRALAEKCSLIEEYDFLLATLNPSVHSSAFALALGGGVPREHITFFAFQLVFRFLGMLGKYHGAPFSSSEVREMVNAFPKNLFTSQLASP
jgi:hypothetical protein